MTMKPSHIIIEVPLDNGGSLSLRSEYQHFLKQGLATMKATDGCPPMSDEDIIRIIDTVISACAKGAANTSVTPSPKPDSEEDKW